MTDVYELLPRRVWDAIGKDPPTEIHAKIVRDYAQSFGPDRRHWKLLTPKEAERLEQLKADTEHELGRDLSLSRFVLLCMKPPTGYNSTGVDFQHSVWRLLRIADAMESHVPAPVVPKPWFPMQSKMGWVYFIQSGEYIKIGFATDVQSRIRGLETGSPLELVLLRQEPGSVDDERAYHKRFQELRVRGEWFRFEGALADLLRSAE